MINNIKNKIKRFFKWIWSECKDWHTFIILLLVIVIMYSPAWLGFLLFFLFNWKWCFSIASAYVLFWAGPFTPFFPLCVATTLGIKKIIKKINKKNN